MEKVLLISDTHNNQIYLRDILLKETDCQTIMHLGDFYEDIDINSDLTVKKKLIRVPGIFHKGYKDRSIPAIQIYQSHNWTLLLVHDLNDATGKSHDADIYLHGHTHRTNLMKKYGKYFFNPGHLKQNTHRGSKATYAILEILEKKIKIYVKDHTGYVIYNKIIEK